jgi:KDO2-lipid IV(A) lauroyltransferase
MKNLVLGLGPDGVSSQAVRTYFRNLGRLFGWSMAVYHRGFWHSGVPEKIEFGASVIHLDQAVAKGHGVVLASPHQFCHELGAAYINGRHKTVALVREEKDRWRQSMKERWFQATGLDTVPRPRRSSVMADTFASLRVLKSGRLLAVTPDLIVPGASGVPVEMFGRVISLSPGLVLLSMKAKAPLVTCYFHWEVDGRIILNFTEPVEYPQTGDRKKTAVEGLQAWCRQCEGYLRENPGNWMFWLDKRWAWALRTTSPEDSQP